MRSLTELREEMRSVARAEKRASNLPAAQDEAPGSLQGVMSPANLALLRTIAERRPMSVSDLAAMLDRKQSNVSRSLQDLARFGLVRLVRDGAAVRPELAARSVTFDITSGTWTLAAAE